MEGNTTALLWITIAAFALLVITMALVFWPALGRRWHALLYNEASHPPSVPADPPPRPAAAAQPPRGLLRRRRHRPLSRLLVSRLPPSLSWRTMPEL